MYKAKINLYMLLQAKEHSESRWNNLFVRMSINGTKQLDFIGTHIKGTSDMFMVKTRLPRGINIALLQMGKCGRLFPANTQMAPNNHIVDIDNDTLLHIKWGKQLRKVTLPEGKQLMFLLRAPSIIPHMSVRGNIRQLGYWNSPPPEQVHLHIPKTACFFSVPVDEGKRCVNFKLVSQTDTGLVWEQPVGSHKTASLSYASSKRDDIVVTVWNEPTVYKTEIRVSDAWDRVFTIDQNTAKILRDTAEMYKMLASERPSSPRAASALAMEGFFPDLKSYTLPMQDVSDSEDETVYAANENHAKRMSAMSPDPEEMAATATRVQEREAQQEQEEYHDVPDEAVCCEAGIVVGGAGANSGSGEGADNVPSGPVIPKQPRDQEEDQDDVSDATQLMVENLTIEEKTYSITTESVEL